MRPIKFRVWDKKEKEMYEPKEEFTCGLVVLLGGFTEYGGCVDYACEPCFEDFQWYNRKIVEERYVLMQFAGLHDKNGKELDWWEGDIYDLHEPGTPHVIIFDKGCFWFEHLHSKRRLLCHQYTLFADDMPKIDDIHQNKDLLESK